MGSPFRSPKSRLCRFANTSTGFCPVNSSRIVLALANVSPPAPKDMLITTFEMKISRMTLSFFALGLVGVFSVASDLGASETVLALAVEARRRVALVLVVVFSLDMFSQPPEWILGVHLRQVGTHTGLP